VLDGYSSREWFAFHPEAEFIRLVERTFAWLSQARRLAKDYERLQETRGAMIHRAMSRIMLRRVAGTVR
jgi:transposase